MTSESEANPRNNFRGRGEDEAAKILPQGASKRGSCLPKTLIAENAQSSVNFGHFQNPADDDEVRPLSQLGVLFLSARSSV